MNKKKTKKPKDELIDSLLEDLKDQSHEDSYRVGPEGMSSDEDEADRTTLLTEEERSGPKYTDEFFVSNEDKTTPMQKAKRDMAVPSDTKGNPLIKLDVDDESEKVFEVSGPKLEVESEEPFQIDPPAAAPVLVPTHQSPSPRAKSSAFESQFSRAENLKVAQQRILELEKDIERYRKENEMLSSANEISKTRIEELISKTLLLEKQRIELKELNESELRIFKDGLVTKDSEIHRLRNKVDDLELRLANDLRKVRVRERELENRL